MTDTPVIQLVTLWFVILTFIQTGSGTADGPLITAIEVLAILLMYVIPLTLAILAGLQLLDK